MPYAVAMSCTGDAEHPGGSLHLVYVPYAGLMPPLPPISPAWSPVAHFGGYGAPGTSGVH
jgi:hypothetical protein